MNQPSLERVTAFMGAMRNLIIASLVQDLPNRCEWGSALTQKEPPYDYIIVVPIKQGFIDYENFPVDLLETFSDELLLELYDCNACLRYR